jgi:hypothetical protein
MIVTIKLSLHSSAPGTRENAEVMFNPVLLTMVILRVDSTEIDAETAQDDRVKTKIR